jgi:hypothetical protein
MNIIEIMQIIVYVFIIGAIVAGCVILFPVIRKKINNDAELSAQKIAESQDQLKMLHAPKSHPQILPYLQYLQAIAQLKTHVKITFQRVYTSEVLPSVMNADSNVIFAAPNDTKYGEFLSKIVMQSISTLPAYLKKSIYYYFEIKDDQDKKDINFNIFIQTVFSQSKGLLDSQLITLAEKAEKSIGPSPQPFLQATKKYGRLNDIDALIESTKSGKGPAIQSPDGSEISTL